MTDRNEWCLNTNVIGKLPVCCRAFALVALRDMGIQTKSDWESLTVSAAQKYFSDTYPHSHTIPRTLLHKRDRCRSALNQLLRLSPRQVTGTKACRVAAIHSTACGVDMGNAAVYHNPSSAVNRWCKRACVAIQEVCHRLVPQQQKRSHLQLDAVSPVHCTLTHPNFCAKDIPPFARLLANSLPLFDHIYVDQRTGSFNLHLLRNPDMLQAWYDRVFPTDALRTGSLCVRGQAILWHLCDGWKPRDADTTTIATDSCSNLVSPWADALQTFYRTDQSMSSIVFAAFYFSDNEKCLRWFVHLCRMCDACGVSQRTRRLYVEAHVTVFHRLTQMVTSASFADTLMAVDKCMLLNVLANLQLEAEQEKSAPEIQKGSRKRTRRNSLLNCNNARRPTGAVVPPLAVTVELIHGALKLSTKGGLWPSAMNSPAVTVVAGSPFRNSSSRQVHQNFAFGSAGLTAPVTTSNVLMVVRELAVPTVAEVRYAVAQQRRHGAGDLSDLKGEIGVSEFSACPMNTQLPLPQHQVSSSSINTHRTGVVAVDHFSEDEITRIAAACLTTFDRAVFAVLRYTALRRLAICRMRIGDVYSLESDKSLLVGVAREKGGQLREYTIPPQLAACIEAWMVDRSLLQLDKLEPTDPIFPRSRNVHEFCTTSEIHIWFAQLARRARVQGPHVHLHAFRKTLVVMLAKLNPLDMVSQWIGHRCTRTTRRYYWNITASELQDAMIIPWQQQQDQAGVSGNDDENECGIPMFVPTSSSSTTDAVDDPINEQEKSMLIDIYRRRIQELQCSMGGM